MELAEIVMNPVRQRIFQYFLLHETGTVKEVRKALPDVPGASLYRHIKILADSSIGNANPRKDMLLFTNCTLLLTDEEFSEYLSEINQVTIKYMKQETSETSKPRQITLISAPTNE